MKKTIALFISLILAFSLVGCSTSSAPKVENAKADFSQTVDEFCTVYNENIQAVCSETGATYNESYSLNADDFSKVTNDNGDHLNKEIGNSTISLTMDGNKVIGAMVATADEIDLAYDTFFTTALMTLTGDSYSQAKTILDKSKKESADYSHYSKYIDGYAIFKIAPSENLDMTIFAATAMTEDEYNERENPVLPEELD